MKQDFHRRAALQARQLGFDVREHADLRRRADRPPQFVQVPQQNLDVVDRVDRRIDADQGIARSQRQPPINQQRHAAQIVRRMIRLQARRQRARAAQRGPSAAGAGHFLRQQHQLVHVANLGHRGGHDAGQPAAERGDFLARRSQQQVFEFAYGQLRDRFEDLAIDIVIDPHDRIDLSAAIGQRPIVEMRERQAGEHGPRGFARPFVRGGQARVAVARLAAIGRAEQSLQSPERELAIQNPSGVRFVRRGPRDGDIF